MTNNVEIIVPSLGESVSEASIAKWYKKQGDMVKADELLLELETEKVTLEVNALASGVIGKILKNQGDVVVVGETVGQIAKGEISPVVPEAVISIEAGIHKSSNRPLSKLAYAQGFIGDTEPRSAAYSDVREDSSLGATHKLPAKVEFPKRSIDTTGIPPSVRKLVTENNLCVTDIKGSGKEGRVTKGDVLEFMNSASIKSAVVESNNVSNQLPIERVKMSRLRKTIAERLKHSQNTAAILTTFNEIDMSKVINLRTQYRQEFEKKHGIKLGFMSFFVKATIEALKAIPSVNAEIDGDDIVYKNYYDIGVAVGTEQGLVVPIVRQADQLTFAGIEKAIAGLGKKAREAKLSMSDLSGGTFTVSNGGVYGSLLSTPIINPPQSGILGLHKTQERPVVINGKIEIRPMMYIALSYDHRIIDGKEAVTFLVKIKELLEYPDRLLLNI